MSTYPYFQCLFALFATKSSPVRAIFRSIHREMICARCAAFQCAKSCIDSFFLARRIKSYNASSEPLFWTEFRYTQILRGRIDDSHGVVFYSPSRHLFTEILFCTLIDTDREIDTDRHQETSESSKLGWGPGCNTVTELPQPPPPIWTEIRCPLYIKSALIPPLRRGPFPHQINAKSRYIRRRINCRLGGGAGIIMRISVLLEG